MIDMISIMLNHLFALVWNMGAHGFQPLERVKYFLFFPIL